MRVSCPLHRNVQPFHGQDWSYAFGPTSPRPWGCGLPYKAIIMHRGGGCKFISKIMLVLNNPLLIFGQQLESENVRDAGDLGDVLVLSLFDIE